MNSKNMSNTKNRLKTLFFMGLACFSACSGVSYSYVDENSRSKLELEVPVSSTVASFEFAVVTNNALPVIESDFPTISAHYSSKSGVADKLKKLEIKLFVDDREITADETDYQASYFNETLIITEAECCEKLGEKLKIGEQKFDTEYGFGVSITKKYKSLKMLPPQITVVISATTDEGKVEMTRKLNLKEYEDSNFIRVH